MPALDPFHPGALVTPPGAAGGAAVSGSSAGPPMVAAAPGVSRSSGPGVAAWASFLALHGVAGLGAAALWAAPRVWLGDAASLSARLFGYLALVGCGSVSLALLSLSFASLASARAPAAVDSVRQWQRALTLGLGLALVPWFGLAYWLQLATHHRPLGAVVFAAGAALVAVPCVALARRLLEPDLRGGARAQLCGAAAVLAGLATLAVIVVGAPLDDLDVRAAVLDLLLGAGLGILLLRALRRPGRGAAPRWLVLGAAITCLGVWAATGWLLQSDTDLRARVKSAPVLAGVVGLLLR